MCSDSDCTACEPGRLGSAPCVTAGQPKSAFSARGFYLPTSHGSAYRPAQHLLSGVGDAEGRLFPFAPRPDRRDELIGGSEWRASLRLSPLLPRAPPSLRARRVPIWRARRRPPPPAQAAALREAGWQDGGRARDRRRSARRLGGVSTSRPPLM